MLLEKELTRKVIQDIITAIKEGVKQNERSTGHTEL